MINYTKEEYRELRKKGIKTNESLIFTNPQNKKRISKIIKRFKDDPEFFLIKMHTIRLLLENKDILSGLNIALPEKLIQIEGVDSGFETKKI